MENTHITHRTSGRKLLFVAAICLLILLSITAGWFYYKYKQALHAPSETQRITAKIKTVVALPDETPSLLTISDRKKLNNKLLISETRDGDRLLVFDRARKIVIYRPSIGKVIDILSIQVPPTGAASLPTRQ